MARLRNENIDKAKEMFLNGMKLIDISKKLGVPEGSVRRWKCTYKWSKDNSERSNKKQTNNKKANVQKKKSGGQPGNKNATGPPGNQNAVKHGLYCKHIPKETLELMDMINKSNPIDLLWDNITIAYAAIIRAQNIMYVENQRELVKQIVSSANGSEVYDIQYAWDRQANFISAQARAMTTLANMIEKYDKLCNSSLTTEEQRLRVTKLKAEIEKMTSTDDEQLDKLDKILGAIDDAAKR